MCYVYFLVLATHAEGEGHLVFDDKFAFLEAGNGGADFLEFRAANSEKVFDDLIVNGLLLHDERVLSISVEVEALILEVAHILSGKNNAQTLVATHGNKIAQRSVVEAQHIMRLVDN